MSDRVLVVAAHADDEALGCGGAIAKHSDIGDKTAALFMTNGVGSRENIGAQEIDARTSAMAKALEILDVSHYKRLDFPDNAMDSVSFLEIVKSIERFCSDWGIPDRIYTHHPSDLNVDHQLTYQAVMTCFRPQPALAGKPTSILTFEVLSSTGWLGAAGNVPFQPNMFIDISSSLERKLKSLRAYDEEMRPWPHARSLESIKHLAKFRGASVGVEAAEAFEIARIIESQ
jgi:LmbE family N-acetylglucosaminyl deacetylase